MTATMITPGTGRLDMSDVSPGKTGAEMVLWQYRDKPLRHTMINGAPYWVLQDVCAALEIVNVSDVRARLNPKGVAFSDTLTAGGIQQMTVINEANLYRCVFRSRTPEAEAFVIWVTEVVIPSIRKTGSYISPTLTAKIEALETEVKSLREAQKRLASVPAGYPSSNVELPIFCKRKALNELVKTKPPYRERWNFLYGRLRALYSIDVKCRAAKLGMENLDFAENTTISDCKGEGHPTDSLLDALYQIALDVYSPPHQVTLDELTA